MTTWDEEYDVVCGGSGVGGLGAAITAAHAGASVLVVEKHDKLGGVTALSGGNLWVADNHLEAKAGLPDSREDALAYTTFLADGMADEKLQLGFYDSSREALQFFDEEIGVPFRIIPQRMDSYFPDAPGSSDEGRSIEVEPFDASLLGEWQARSVAPPTSYGMGADQIELEPKAAAAIRVERKAKDLRCQGAGLSGHLLLRALEHGVTFDCPARIVRLVVDDGAVTGVVVRRPSGEVTIRARKGVVLALGGYDWNPTLMTSFEQAPDFHSAALSTTEGDHLALGAEVGGRAVRARPGPANTILAGVHFEVPSEPDLPRFHALKTGRPGGIVVDRSGRRFANEAFFPEQNGQMSTYLGPKDGYPHWPAYYLFDETFRTTTPLGPVAAGAEIPGSVGVVSAESIPELAERLGLPADALIETVERFNAFCERGVDEDFHRGDLPWERNDSGDARRPGNPNLAPLTTPPFHGLRLVRVGVGIPSAGLEIDDHGRVLGPDGPVPGLYSAGNSAAQLDVGSGYASGMANTRGLATGYRATPLDMCAS